MSPHPPSLSKASASDDVAEALAALSAGRLVVVVDATNDDGALIGAADRIDAQTMAFVVRYSSGFVYVTLPDERADRLGLPALAEVNRHSKHFAGAERVGFCVSADAAEGTTTGISAHDRARTALTLANPASTTDDLTRPGHTIPIRVAAAGLLDRTRFAEAATDLCRMAGAEPLGVVATIVSQDDERAMARGAEVRQFAEKHRLPKLDLHELVGYRVRRDAEPRERRATRIALAAGTFERTWYRFDDGSEQIGLCCDRPDGAPAVHVHRECPNGDAFESTECDCGPRLQQHLRDVARHGGAVIYVRGQPTTKGRGCPATERVGVTPEIQRKIDIVCADLGVGRGASTTPEK